MHSLSLLLYRLFIWLYPATLKLVSPWNTKARRWLKGREHILLTIRESMPAKKGRTIWMHCASLGEFEQGRPVLESIRRHYPEHTIVLTFFSPSGYDSARSYRDADVVCYLPMDSATNAKQLIEIIEPSLVLWVKYDYWYFYLSELKERGIPVLLISGLFRKQQAFFQWYGVLQRRMLRSVTHFFVQNEHSQQLLISLGVKNVSVSGDTRFDRVIEIAAKAGEVEGAAEFCSGAAVIVAGSTWNEDEEELDHFANTHPQIKFIIAPHEVDETRIAEAQKLFRRSIRYSEFIKQKTRVGTVDNGTEETNNDSSASAASDEPYQPNVLIIDNIGLLSRLYRYATICWVGGGFGNDGVHNVLEAAVYGKPVVFGPVYDKYLEAVELVGSGGGFSVENALEAEGLFTTLLMDNEEYQSACEASMEYVYSKQGATARIVAYIHEKRLLTS